MRVRRALLKADEARERRRRHEASGARVDDVLGVFGEDARRHVAHGVLGAPSHVREQWQQRVHAPPKQLITTRRLVYLNNNMAFLKATSTDILTHILTYEKPNKHVLYSV